MKGHIWRTGFEGQEIKGVVFDDVPPALEKWHASGIKVLAPPLLINLYMWIRTLIIPEHILPFVINHIH